MIKYLGSKRLLLPQILAAAAALPDVETVLDLFSGTSRVGHALKGAGYHVTANDHLAYAAALARCYVQANRDRVLTDAERIITELNHLKPKPGYFTKTFCEESRFFQPENGARVDAARERIRALALDPVLEAVVLTSLMEAADRVDSTTGVQMAYLKQWATRAQRPLHLRMPDVLPGEGQSLQLDAAEAAAVAPVDLAYLDPPYNQHSYMGNYHVWETLVRWDAPEAYGVARKRLECREYKSPFNSKRAILGAFRQVVASLRAKHLLISFNDEGHLTRDEITEILAERGHVEVVEVDFKRYVGAQIGIHNPEGKRVGRVGKLRNKELFFVVSPSKDDALGAARAMTGARAS
ncbi:MAG: DNA adenine methylase [Myxococcales bacterium]|nr:DNA adenine methylase [Myxococcales bacterium]